MADAPPRSGHRVWPDTEGWVLAGGEGRRMGGDDKGLIEHQGMPLARQTAQALAAQLAPASLTVIANRNLDAYAQWGWPVMADDPDLPPRSGPTIGLLTALRHAKQPWVQVVPCDSPALPADLVDRLRRAAVAHQALVAVPVSTDAQTGEARHHWTTPLVHQSARAALEQRVGTGERRVRLWIQSLPWVAVPFGVNTPIQNLNTPDSLRQASLRPNAP